MGSYIHRRELVGLLDLKFLLPLLDHDHLLDRAVGPLRERRHQTCRYADTGRTVVKLFSPRSEIVDAFAEAVRSGP